MDAAEWMDILDDDEALSWPAREACLKGLLSDAPPGCLYCRLEDLDEGDDE